MKKSDEWNRQDVLDDKLDNLIEQEGLTPGEAKPYSAAQALGVNPSGEFYKKFNDWQTRREREADQPWLEASPRAKVKIENMFADFSSRAVEAYLDEIRTVSGDIDRAANLRVDDAERRLEQKRAEVSELLERWIEAEAQRDELQERVNDLEEKLSATMRRGDQLLGRLREREALRREIAAYENYRVSSETLSAEGQPKPEHRFTSQDAHTDIAIARALVAERMRDDSAASVAEPGKEEPLGSNQSSINEGDGQQVHQSEMSLVRTEEAGTAEVRDDDND